MARIPTPDEHAHLTAGLRAQLAQARIPAGFHVGAATAGYQIEGSFNGPDEPRNNWYDWDHTGKVEPAGIAIDSWNRWSEDLDAVARFGGNAYRLSIEWARVQPTVGPPAGDAVAPDADRPFDQLAIDRYADQLVAARARGIEPYVTLHHFTHPRWLGDDFWQQETSPARFGRYVREIVPQLNAALVARGTGPIERYITINEISILSLQTFGSAIFPGARRPGNLRAVARAFDHLLAAHIRAYDAIHDTHADHGWVAPMVTTNTYTFSNYELDRALSDLCVARTHGVTRAGVGAWLAERRADWYRRAGTLDGPDTAWEERAVNALTAKVMPLPLPTAADAHFASSRDRHLDAISIDWYTPWQQGRFKIPGHRTAGGRNWLPGRILWDDPPLPDSFTAFMRAMDADYGLPIWIVETGLCNRVERGVAFPRWDGWTRVRYLKEHLARVAVLVTDGVAIEAFLPWCLFDNYEWGMYGPRFGLYGIDRERGVRRLEHDSFGGDAAGALAAMITALRTGEGIEAAFA